MSINAQVATTSFTLSRLYRVLPFLRVIPVTAMAFILSVITCLAITLVRSTRLAGLLSFILIILIFPWIAHASATVFLILVHSLGFKDKTKKRCHRLTASSLRQHKLDSGTIV
jgi:hypothetical protein